MPRSRRVLGLALAGLALVGLGARRAGPAGMILVDAQDQVFVRIPAGIGWIGLASNDTERQPDEARRRARLDRPFYLASTEVTQGLWKAVLGTDPARTERGRSATNPGLPGPPCADWGVADDLPVFCVTFEEALAFCNALSLLYGLEEPYGQDDEGTWIWHRQASGYRLPTQLEWEYAARAGTGFAWDGTDDAAHACERANVADTVGPPRVGEPFPCADGHSGPAPVGKRVANDWGVHDMTGNVAEWVWWDRELEEVPIRMQQVHGPWLRMRRGGSFIDGPRDARLGRRSRVNEGYRWPDTGLRVARNG